MTSIVFLTTNADKVFKANLNLQQYNVQLKQIDKEVDEIQSLDGEEVARQKAQTAFEAIQQPVLINDDFWSIPRLNGFPAANMKMCNHFLQAADWLRLMDGVLDRRVFMTSNYAFHNGKTIHLVSQTTERYFLHQAQGNHANAPALEVIARKGRKTSIAQDIESGDRFEAGEEQFWQQLAQVVRGRE